MAEPSRDSADGTFHQKFEQKHSPTLRLKNLFIHCSLYSNFSTLVLDTHRNLMANSEIL